MNHRIAPPASSALVDEARPDERRERLGRPAPQTAAALALAEAAGEHGEAREQSPAPRRRAAGSSSRSSSAACAGATAGRAPPRPRARASPDTDASSSCGRVVARPRRRELDRERQAVEPPAQLRHLVGLLAGPAEARRDRAGARGEQPDRIRQRQRLDAVLVLAGEPQRRPARGEHDQPGRRAQQLAHQRRRGVDHLEVVEQQQGPAPAEERPQRGDRRLVALRGEPEHARDRVGHQLRVGQVREVDEVDAVGEPLGEVVPGLEREPRLADAPGPGQRHQPRAAAQQRRQLGELGLAADERRRRRREVPARAQLGRLDGERRVLLEDRPLQLLQRGPGLEAELVAHRVGAPAGTPRARRPAGRSGRGRASAARRAARGSRARRPAPRARGRARDGARARGRPRSGPRAPPAAAPPAAPPRPARTPRSARPRRPARATARAPRGSSTPPRRARPAPARRGRARPGARTARGPARRAPGAAGSRARPARSARGRAAGAARARGPAARSRPPRAAARPRARRSAGRARRPRRRATSRHASSATCLPDASSTVPIRRRPARARARGTPRPPILCSRTPLRKLGSRGWF